MTVSRAEPRFDLDLKYGQEAEARISKIFKWFGNGDRRLEVKRKRYLDHYIYVETHCDKGRTGVFEPSGINRTTAAIWFFVIDRTDIHITLPTALLRSAMDDPSSQDREEKD